MANKKEGMIMTIGIGNEWDPGDPLEVHTESTQPAPEPEPPQLRLVRYLRQLADFYEFHPALEIPIWLKDFNLTAYPKDDPAVVLGSIGAFEKVYDESSSYAFKAVKHLPDGTLELRFERERVCKRKVVGKRVVPQQVVPAEFTPEQVIPEHEVEVVEWECEPVLKGHSNDNDQR